MKRVTAALVVAGFTFVAGCQNWNAELNNTMSRLNDGGTKGGDAGVDSGNDSGSDGGTDAGCTAQLCLSQSFAAGFSFSPISVIDQSTFLSVGRSLVGAAQLAIFTDGGFALTSLASTISGPVGLLAQSPTDYFIAGENGVTAVRDGGAQTSRGCNTPSVPSWWAVSGDPASTVVFVGDFGSICNWTADGGFEGVDLGDITNPSTSEWLTGVVAFGNGERFIVGDNGLLMHWAPPAIATLQRHSALNSDMQAIDGPSPEAIWAAGQFGLLARWEPNSGDGGSWLEAPSVPGVTRDVTRLWVRTNEDVWLVGMAGLLKHWNGTAWSNVSAEEVDSTVDLKGVRGSGSEDLMLSGTRNLADGGELGLLLYYRRTL